MKKLFRVMLILFGASMLTACLVALDPMGPRPKNLDQQQQKTN